MPSFRGEFDVHADVVLSEGTAAFAYETASGHSIKLTNTEPDLEGHVPGLIARVIGPAESFDDASNELRNVLAAQLDLLSFSTHSRFKIVGARRVMEWEPGKKTIKAKIFKAYDSRYPPDPQITSAFLPTLRTLNSVAMPDFTRSALRHFRNGLLDSTPEDQFMRLWLAVEIVAVNTRGNAPVPIPCRVCAANMTCPGCGLVPTRIPLPNDVIRETISLVFGEKADAVSKRMFKARHGLMHGASRASVEADCKMPMGDLVNELGALAWNAISLTFDLGDGPQLQFMTWDGDFAGGTMTTTVTVEFGWEGDGEYPQDEKLPTFELSVETRLNAPAGQFALGKQ